MFSGLRPYAGTGGNELPVGWRTTRLAALGRVFKANGGSKEDDVESGVPCIRYGDLYTRYGPVIRVTTRSVDAHRASSYTRLQYGDLIFAASGETEADIGRSAAVLVEGEVVAGGDIIVLRPMGAVNPAYLGWALDSAAIRAEKAKRATGSMIVHISPGAIKTLDVPIPPPAEQGAIVKYLAHAHGRIGRAIDAKRRLIALLEERKQVFIDLAVTKGLDIDVPMVDSGSDWLGRHPRTWRVVRLKSLISQISQGWSPQCDAQRPAVGEWGVLKAGCVNYGVFRPAESKRLASHLMSKPELQVKRGDILMSRANTLSLVGSVALVDREPERTMLSDKIYRFRVESGDANPEFLVKALASSQSRAQIQSAASGASFSMQNISQDVVRDMVITLPPIDEQLRIVDAIALETATTDRAIGRAHREIELLQEFRTRLTADVVTGQVDVREIAADMPDIDPAELTRAVTASGDADLSSDAIDYLEDITA